MNVALPGKSLSREQTGVYPSRGDFSWKGLVILAVVYFVAASFFYFAGFFLHAKQENFWAGIADHLSIAFLILLLLIGVEYRAKKKAHEEFARSLAELSRYREQVAQDVFEAVLGRIVPEPIVEEVRQILSTPVMKSQCEYIITLEAGKNMPPGYAVLRRDLKFRVENLLEQPTTFPILSYYTSDEDLASAAWRGRPFHVKLEVDGKEITPEEIEGLDNKRHFKLEYKKELAPRGSADVFLRGEEPVRIEAGRSSYVQSTPVDALTVSIRNELREIIQDVEVQMHHPAWNRVEVDRNLNRYVLRRAFLPGQGFEVSWRKGGPQPKAVSSPETSNVSQTEEASK